MTDHIEPRDGLRCRRRSAGQSGAAAIEVLTAVAAALALTLFLFNALLMLYARSVIQHAADVGARAGALTGNTVTDCKEQAERTIADLANLYASSAPVVCQSEPFDKSRPLDKSKPHVSTATITARLEPMFPAFGPDWSFTIRAASAAEPNP